MRVGILTVSDRSFRGERADLGGPALERAIREGWAPVAPEGQRDVDVAAMAVVPDERDLIAAKLAEWADLLQLDLVLTTGGTGFAPRDVTPEATLDVIERSAPGLAEAIRGTKPAHHPARHAQPRGRRHPQAHLDRQPARQPERRGRESCDDHAGAATRHRAAA